VNVLLISPHFPPPVWKYAQALAAEGAQVLGIADAPWTALPEPLRRSLSDYVRVPDLERYEALEHAARLLVGRHGRLHRVESLNEHWLVHEARLREALHVQGPRPAEVTRLRSKEGMRALFRSQGLPCTEGEPCRTPEQVRAFAERVGWPVVLKPDVGVGAQRTRRCDGPLDLDEALRQPLAGMVVERFVEGRLTSYDGLCDAQGRVLFQSSQVYGAGVMETVNEQRTASFHSRRTLPTALEALGRAAVAACGLRERFFHVELFEESGGYRLLEVNVRPPGGFIVEMMSHASGGDLYRLWAKMLCGKEVLPVTEPPPLLVAHVGRRRSTRYRLTHEAAMQQLGAAVWWQGPLPPLLATAMGDDIYLLASEREPELLRMIELLTAV